MPMIQFPNGDSYEGETRFGKPHGEGKMIFANGGNYEGQFKGGKFHGTGIRIWVDGERYEGQWQNGNRHGQGCYTNPDGASWDGEWKKDEFVAGERRPPNAKKQVAPAAPVGEFQHIDYDNGNMYEGTMLEGKYHGKGLFRWADGSSYEGDWVRGERSGKGIYRWANDNSYEGDFIAGKRTGKGIYRWASGNTYQGDFIDGKCTGKGVFTWGPGKWEDDRYEGEFLNGYRHGHGIYYYGNGNAYTGQWQNGNRHGSGTFVYANGSAKTGCWENDVYVEGSGTAADRYEGQKTDGLPDGDGTMYYGDGQVYTGEWTLGKRDGTGMLIRPDGSGLKGSWYDDKFSDGNRLHPGSGNAERRLTLPYGEYEGDILDMEPHGWGIMDYSDGKHYEGDWEKGLEHGYGVMTHPDGGFEDGTWEKGEFLVGNSNVYDEEDVLPTSRVCINGMAVRRLPNGNIEAGEFVDSILKKGFTYHAASGEISGPSTKLVNGKVVEYLYTGAAEHLYYENGEEYFGEVENGQSEGYGIMIYPDGSYYWGYVSQGYRQGFGTYLSADGVVKHGEWDNDEDASEQSSASDSADLPQIFHNCRDAEYSDASQEWHDQPYCAGIYKGKTLQGEPDGYGIQLNWMHSGDEYFVGHWSNGYREYGVLYDSAYQTVEAGNFIGNAWFEGYRYNPHTQELTCKTHDLNGGKMIERKTAMAAKHLYYKNGDEYFGETSNGYPDGYGIMLYADGSCFWGFFIEGQRQGTGECVDPKHSYYCGEWDDDEYIG